MQLLGVILGVECSLVLFKHTPTRQTFALNNCGFISLSQNTKFCTTLQQCFNTRKSQGVRWERGGLSHVDWCHRDSKGNCRDNGCRPGRTCRLLLRTCINCKMAHIQRIQTFQNFNESPEKILSIPSNKAQPESKIKERQLYFTY